MSHYLEHMLFMGSERFPDENDYDAFLQRHGGAANAYTEMVGRDAACAPLFNLRGSYILCSTCVPSLVGDPTFSTAETLPGYSALIHAFPLGKPCVLLHAFI